MLNKNLENNDLKRLKEAIQIAKQIRKQCEIIAPYSDLQCWCGIASCALSKALTKKGISNKIIFGEFRRTKNERGDDHCCILVGDKIIDITATQFGISRSVYVVSSNNYSYKYFNAIKGLRSFFRTWPSDQKPRKKLIEKIAKTDRK